MVVGQFESVIGLELEMPASRFFRLIASVVVVIGIRGNLAICQEMISVGVAKVDATPKHPVVLAGYGGRDSEFDGIDSKLWARALVIGQQRPAVVVVLDNCGIPRNVTSRLAQRLSRHGIEKERLVVSATHTHNAPSLTGYAPILWAGRTTPQQDRNIASYTSYAIDTMEAAVVAALKARLPMKLEWAKGRVTFGGNRRVLNRGNWTGFGFQRNGPVDHSLPMLAARDSDGTVRAIWANYACHCTTVGSRNRVGGDWAGFANDAMEKEFPKAVALTTIGCGADIGPQPSGNLEIAERHGRAIADEVSDLLKGETKPLSTDLVVVSDQVRLPLEEPKPLSHWKEQSQRNDFHGQLAKSVLQKIEKNGSIPTHVDYPISFWSFGDDLAMIFLAGEVVVDYSVRLNRELDWSRLWITAWANDMPGYIPSRRVLIEGGYEPDFSQVYYGQPGRYKLEVENVLVTAIRKLVGARFSRTEEQTPAPFHQIPSGESAALQRLHEWLTAERSAADVRIINAIRSKVATATAAVDESSLNGGEETDWHNFAGDFTHRRFIRQTTKKNKIHWDTSVPQTSSRHSHNLCFLGGVGWISEPTTAGFEMTIGEDRRIQFDVTLKPARWQSDDESAELIYLPTWNSNVDSGGFFFLTILNADKGKSLSISVRSLGENSKRWFAIDTNQRIVERLGKLKKAFETVKVE